MDRRQLEALLEAHLRRPSERNFRAVLDHILGLEPSFLNGFAIPYLVERFQDWPTDLARSVPVELRDQVDRVASSAPISRIFHEPRAVLT